MFLTFYEKREFKINSVQIESLDMYNSKASDRYLSNLYLSVHNTNGLFPVFQFLVGGVKQFRAFIYFKGAIGCCCLVQFTSFQNPLGIPYQ